MKKHKSKSKNISANKKLRKEIENKLTTAFNEVLAQFGKAKKTEQVIEKFAKRLSKKISLKPLNDSIDPFIKEEVAVLAKEKTAKPVSTKKIKSPVTEELESK
ncbi:hypothetical protein EV200_101401 [Pedobacter psychrotolerans]|uniref:Uncharacterized protein n=1 Tax=Pedobacter psychrotolerans TaxID=1843235 RepID=A0A4R2HLJ2_9SPHI|nr:hypothetical protein [Pedobacter psychrotolerans]TCO30960.1 hypothetical protein EV200_101401 [Pedobacter psychrotolerans]GGE43263.1 hypothetical protein GCM10011413_06510 [Pedobacter psychrotolerans]